MNNQRTLAILNLTGELTPELQSYFKARGILVVDPLVSTEEADWTHILTRDILEYSLINKTYDLTLKQRHIISLSKVQDLQNFTLNNGNLILDDIWFKGQTGQFIMDKYFQGYGGITLGDNYPTFKETGSFNVTNPFNTGEYLDRMVQRAFEEGIGALTVKTYFDHLVMYVTGLKQKGKAGLPFEVTYGTFEDVFGLQMHFFCKPLDLMDVTTSLSSSITKKAEEYYLNTAIQSSDFFDFSYMAEVSKVVVTALWTKDERIKYENRGMMFTSLLKGVTLSQYKTDEVTSSLVPTPEITDNSDKVVIPDKLGKEVLEKSVVKGLSLEKETISLVKGALDTSDEPTLINGKKELEDFVNVVKGKFEDDKDVIRVSGDKLDLEQTALRIAATVDESAKDSNLKIRALGEKLPEAIKTGLLDFAKNHSKPVEDLSNEELDEFQLVSLPGIIRDGIINDIHESDVTEIITGEETSDEPLLIKGSSELDQLISVVKGRFEDDKEIIRLSNQKLDIDKTAFRIAATIDESTEETNLKVRSLGDKLPNSIKTGLFDFAKLLNKNVEDLSDSDIDDFQVQRLPDIIREGLLTQKLMAAQIPVSSEEVSPIAKVLENKLMKANNEMERLKKENKNLYSEVRILKESRQQMVDVQMRAKEAASEISQTVTPDQDDELRKHFQQKLAEQKTLNDMELKKLSGLLERESKLIADVREEEIKAKRLQIEAIQKETFFAQEIEKSQRQSKAKDLMIIKTKETFTKLVDKKEREISDMKSKLDQVTKALSSGSAQNQTTMIRELERQNQNLGKQLEVYKGKISSLAMNMQSKSEDTTSKDEFRKIQMLNTQMKNQLDFSKKELLKLSEKSIMDNSQITTLKQEKSKLEALLKKAASGELIPESTGASTTTTIVANDQELKRIQAHNQILENQLKDAGQKIAALEAKLTESMKPQKSGGNGDDGSKVKVAQLETSVKKLTQDLVENRNQLAEAKKETNKLRQDKTALQNQLDKLKKEVEKGKSASAKKPGGKAA